MGEIIKVIKQNESFIKINTSAGVEDELYSYFAFRVPGFQYMPAYRNKLWDGYHRLFNRQKKQLFLGLIPYLQQFAIEREYELELDDALSFQETDIDEEDFQKFIKSLKLPFTIKDYQRTALLESIKTNRNLIISPTGSGKSLIIYCLIRWFMRKSEKENFKILLLVPTTSLVEQMHNDFVEYAENDPSFSEKELHKIYQGKEKLSDSPVFISTWQSLYKNNPQYFQQFDMIIGDEAHQAKANSLSKIISACVNAKYRFGTTGTLDNEKVHKLTLEGLFGAQFRATTTEKLMSRGDLAKLKINCILLQYSDEERKFSKSLRYSDEISWILAHSKRNKLLTKLAVTRKGNTLVAFKHIAHGKLLYDKIKEVVGDSRRVFFIDGSTKVEIREQSRKITENEKDAIIVASLGVFSTGINIKNLDNIIFTTPSKSRIRVLQSIGRVLRVGDSDTAKLYDIADDLCWRKTHKNFSFKHFIDRLNIYIEEKFEYKLHKISL